MDFLLRGFNRVFLTVSGNLRINGVVKLPFNIQLSNYSTVILVIYDEICSNEAYF